jgi:hypothetical protein
MGTVWGFVYQGEGPQTDAERMPTNFGDLEDHERELPIVLVQMDGYDDPLDPTKSSFPYSCHDKVPRIVPLVAVSNSSRLVIGEGKYTRFMLPFVVAHGRTGHSIQGYTSMYGIVDDVGSPFFAGEYVALSRARAMEQIHLLAPLQEKYFTSQPEYRLAIHLEYQRLLNKYDQTTFCKTVGGVHEEVEDVEDTAVVNTSLANASLLDSDAVETADSITLKKV